MHTRHFENRKSPHLHTRMHARTHTHTRTQTPQCLATFHSLTSVSCGGSSVEEGRRDEVGLEMSLSVMIRVR